MSISFEYEKVKDMPLRCFRCEHMKALRVPGRTKYQCCYNTCKIEEERREAEKQKQEAEERKQRTA